MRADEKEHDLMKWEHSGFKEGCLERIMSKLRSGDWRYLMSKQRKGIIPDRGEQCVQRPGKHDLLKEMEGQCTVCGVCEYEGKGDGGRL